MNERQGKATIRDVVKEIGNQWRDATDKIVNDHYWESHEGATPVTDVVTSATSKLGEGQTLKTVTPKPGGDGGN